MKKFVQEISSVSMKNQFGRLGRIAACLLLASAGAGAAVMPRAPQVPELANPNTGWQPQSAVGYRLDALPPEPTPIIPAGNDVILYIHGGPGSRLEEASDLAKPLLEAGLRHGRRYTIISFDQPNQGYSSMVDPSQILPAASQAPAAPPQVIRLPMDAHQDDTFSDHFHMHTDIKISKNPDGSGALHGDTHTWSMHDALGFHGSVAVAILDTSKRLLWVSPTHTYGVVSKVHFSGQSDRHDGWDNTIPAQVLAQARHLAITQRWDPKANLDLNNVLRGVENVANELGQIVQTIKTDAIVGFIPGAAAPPDTYPHVQFSEDFIAALIDQLDRTVAPIKKDRNIYIIGGSTGGALTLRMGHRPDPWIKKIVAWNPASVWETYYGNPLKQGTALKTGFDRAKPEGPPEKPGTRGDYFQAVFGQPTDFTQPNPEEWYRGDRDKYVGNKAPFSSEWPCKWEYIAAARLEQEEIYNELGRRWHWTLGTEVLLFSFFNDSWIGPARNASDSHKPANYEGIIKPTLLVAGQDDDWNEGGVDFEFRGKKLGDAEANWENRWTQTTAMAPKMRNTPGHTLFLACTGHSIHNERPQFFAEAIASFLSTETETAGPMQVLPILDLGTNEDKDCQRQLCQFPAIPQQLLQNPASARFLMEPANLHGKFRDGTNAGAYSLRLRSDLRSVAQRMHPVVALASAAAAFYNGDTNSGNAFADLAVTGRNVYDAFRKHPPTDPEVAGDARKLLVAQERREDLSDQADANVAKGREKAPKAKHSTPTVDESDLLSAVRAARTRAYQVAWALRNPDSRLAYQLRRTLGWIAVSAEDDAPDRPVNVPSGIPILDSQGKQVSAYPQFDLPVTMPGTHGPVTLQTRYTIASAQAAGPMNLSGPLTPRLSDLRK